MKLNVQFSTRMWYNMCVSNKLIGLWSVKGLCGSVYIGVFFRLAAIGLVAGVSFRGGASESAVLIVARA